MIIGKPRIWLGIFALVLLAAWTALTDRPTRDLRAAVQDQQNQPTQQSPTNQTQQTQQGKQDSGQTSQDQQRQKKKGSFFGGLKSVTGQSSEQTQATATAGNKAVGEGKKIGEMTPTAADRQEVTDMENHSVQQKDLKKFQDDGHLQPRQ